MANKAPIRFTIPAATKRNPLALHASQRKAGAMKHKTAGRGGQCNEQRALLDEMYDEEASGDPADTDELFPFDEEDAILWESWKTQCEDNFDLPLDFCADDDVDWAEVDRLYDEMDDHGEDLLWFETELLETPNDTKVG